MQVLRSIRLLRRANVATAPAPKHRLSNDSRDLCSMASASRWWLARGVSPFMAAPNPYLHLVSRSPHGRRNMTSDIAVKGGEELGKPYRDLPLPSINDKPNATRSILDTSECPLDSDGEESWGVQLHRYTVDGVFPLYILPRSRHRDGSIFRGPDEWKEEFCIADRNETRFEAMKLSDPADCVLRDDGTCMRHRPSQMLQIFSLKLTKIHMDGGLVELYGYIAVRDGLDQLLNYVINISRDDPIIVQKGSLIGMAGPKRGIELLDTIVIEYDMRIKTGKQEKDDLQLIDGASMIDDRCTEDCNIFRKRMHGGCGAIEITVSRIDYAVEATIEVLISEVYSSFNLCLGCFTSGLQKEIQLFDGVIGNSLGLKRSVVAVKMGTSIDLKFNIGSESSISAEHCCSFMVNQHGCISQEIKTDRALISVKVTWSTLP